MNNIKEFEAIIEEIKSNAAESGYRLNNERFQETMKMLDYVKANPEDKEIQFRLEARLNSCRFWSKVDDKKAKAFTVGSMIEMLKQYPEDMEVWISATADCGYIRAGGRLIQPMVEEGKYLTLFNDEDWNMGF